MLKIYPLKNAFNSLVKGMKRAEENPADLEVRDACIQRFEYTYELDIKFIKRYLENIHPTTEKVDQLNYRDLLRLATEAGLIDEVESWFAFREARNQTSHAYDEAKAKQVFEVIPSFIKKTKYFLEQLERKINQA